MLRTLCLAVAAVAGTATPCPAFAVLDPTRDFLATDLASDRNFGVVAEPASWAMLIIGFGLIGGVARRHPLAVLP